jgi:hypothetical protein
MKLTWIREYKFCKLTFTAEAEDVGTLIEIFDRVQTGKSNIGSKLDVPEPPDPANIYSNKDYFI